MESQSPIREKGILGLAAWVGQTHGMTGVERHLDLEINYVLSGPMRYLVGGRIVTLPPRHLCLIWGGVPHQMLLNNETTEAIWVMIPADTVLRWGLPDRLIHPLLATGFVVDPAPRPGDLDQLRQWLDDLPVLEERKTAGSPLNTAEGIVLLEIEVRLRRIAQALDRGPGLDTDAVPIPITLPGHQPDSAAHYEKGLAAVEAMAQFITRNFQNVVTFADIAEQAHLHPNYAITLFRRHTGMTPGQYLVLQRVAHAQRLLATTSTSIEEIAFDSGFGSASRFYEAFRKQTGNSPRRFRLHMNQKNGSSK
ncbi:MAG: helix-turn-helix domain-containing protein [Armatimonadota bacterium]